MKAQGLILLIVFALPSFSSAVKFYEPKQSSNSTDDRVDCAPDNTDIDQVGCESARGCIFDSPGPLSNAPSCFYPPDYGFSIYGQVHNTPTGFQVELLKQGSPAFVPDEFGVAIVDVDFQTESRLRVRFRATTDRYEVPIAIPNPTSKPPSTLYDVEFATSPSFAFRVLRRSNGAVIFDSSLGGLTLADQFLQVSGRLASDAVFGIGEEQHNSLKRDMDFNDISE